MTGPKTRQDEDEVAELPKDREDYYTWQEDDIVWVDPEDLEPIPDEEAE